MCESAHNWSHWLCHKLHFKRVYDSMSGKAEFCWMVGLGIQLQVEHSLTDNITYHYPLSHNQNETKRRQILFVNNVGCNRSHTHWPWVRKAWSDSPQLEAFKRLSQVRFLPPVAVIMYYDIGIDCESGIRKAKSEWVTSVGSFQHWVKFTSYH